MPSGSPCLNSSSSKIDCDAEKNTCKDHGITKFPTLKAIAGNVVVPYDGDWDIEGFKKWAIRAGTKETWTHGLKEVAGDEDVSGSKVSSADGDDEDDDDFEDEDEDDVDDDL